MEHSFHIFFRLACRKFRHGVEILNGCDCVVYLMTNKNVETGTNSPCRLTTDSTQTCAHPQREPPDWLLLFALRYIMGAAGFALSGAGCVWLIRLRKLPFAVVVHHVLSYQWWACQWSHQLLVEHLFGILLVCNQQAIVREHSALIRAIVGCLGFVCCCLQ